MARVALSSHYTLCHNKTLPTTIETRYSIKPKSLALKRFYALSVDYELSMSFWRSRVSDETNAWDKNLIQTLVTTRLCKLTWLQFAIISELSPPSLKLHAVCCKAFVFLRPGICRQTHKTLSKPFSQWKHSTTVKFYDAYLDYVLFFMKLAALCVSTYFAG